MELEIHLILHCLSEKGKKKLFPFRRRYVVSAASTVFGVVNQHDENHKAGRFISIDSTFGSKLAKLNLFSYAILLNVSSHSSKHESRPLNANVTASRPHVDAILNVSRFRASLLFFVLLAAEARRITEKFT